MPEVALPGVWVVLLEVVLGLASGAVFGASRTRRAAAAALVLLGLVVPFLGDPAEPAARALAGLGAMLGVMRLIEAHRLRAPLPIPRALGWVLPVDLVALRRAAPRVATDALGSAGAHAVLLAAGVTLVAARARCGASAPLVAWLGGTLALYGAVDVASSTLRAFLAAFGIESAPMQRHPVLSASVSEFWGERWNRAVGAWLWRQCVVRAMRRGGRLAGIAAAFGWSALLHFYSVLAGVGVGPALCMAAFFVVEGLAVLIETRLSVRTWPRPLARLWTFALVLGPSWLFVGPVLEIFGVG